MADVTNCLNASGDGTEGEMFGKLYAELKKIARSRMRGERAGHTLDATALVHEAWMRLEKSSPEHWNNRNQFYGVAAEAMRRILVESARRRLTKKRGEGEGHVPLEGVGEYQMGEFTLAGRRPPAKTERQRHRCRGSASRPRRN